VGKATSSSGAPGQAVIFGMIVWFVAAIDLIRFIRADLLISPEVAWAIPRLVLTVFLITASGSAGVLAAGLFFLWSRTPASTADTQPLPLSRNTLRLIAGTALCFGVLARFAWLDSIPPTLWIDELAPVRPSLALKGNVADLADPIRMMRISTDSSSYTVTSVVQLEAYRFLLHRLGTTILSIRFPAALAAALLLLTTMLLARTLLPQGGAAVAGVILAGLRWQLIMGRFAWNVLALTLIVDLATLLLLRARRRSSLAAAAAGGLLAGLGAHVYLGAWIAGAALGVFLLLPQVIGPSLRRRMALSALYGLGFLAAVLPIFLLEKGRPNPYFDRASDQSLLKDLRRTGDGMIPLNIVADSFQAPWLIADHQDLPKSKLGWIIGIPFAAALLRAVRSPMGELSALLFCHAGAAVAASLRWGLPGHPNGYRFLYLTSLTAVAASAGVLWIIQLRAPSVRRPATLAAFGLLGVGALLGTREALVQWGLSRGAFDSYWGGSTLVGRAALRWERYGRVDIDPLLRYSSTVAGQVWEFALDPDQKRQKKLFAGSNAGRERGRCFWITGVSTAPAQKERRTEIVRDAWGRDYAVVLARPCRNS
jgi:hypothetical protein